MDPDDESQCSSGYRVTFDDKQSKDRSQGKKSRQNDRLDNGAARPKQRAPGGITANGAGPATGEPSRAGNARVVDVADPYSVACNVDSKTSIDKCFASKIDSSDRKAEGFQMARCSWSLDGVQNSPYRQQVSCEDNDREAHDVKINNTEADPVNGGARVNNLEFQFSQRNCTLNKLTAGVGTTQNDFNINVPSATNVNGNSSTSRGSVGNERPEVGEPAGALRAGRKRPARGRERKTQPPREDDSSSDTGNDDYSVGSDDVIYTYRGGEHLADLPSSFFSLDMGLAVDHHLPAPPLFGPRPEPLLEDRAARDSGASSPDMDFLEMDFDPGPSCEADSNEESSLDLDLDAVDPPVLNNPCLREDGLSGSPDLAEKNPEKETDSVILGDNKISNPCKSIDKVPLETPAVEDNLTPAAVRVNGVGLGFSMEPSTSRASFPSTSSAHRQEAPLIQVEPHQEESVAKSPKRNAKKSSEEHRPYGTLIAHTTLTGETIHVRRTSLSWPSREVQGHHSSSGDLVSPGETCEGDLPESLSWTCLGGILPEQGGILEANRVNLSSALFHCTMAKRLVVDKQSTNFLQEQDTSNVDGAGAGGSGEPPAVTKCMVWSEQEACSRQVTQIGTSACGATAVINALLGLQQAVEVERVISAVCTRQRANSAPLCRYLVSRSVAGCGARALGAGLRAGSAGSVTSRHFSTWPERALPLSHWLAYWIGLGAVPIATLNLQAGVADPGRTPDSWHHQMIFGVSPRGIYMANPVECVEEGALWHQLCSDSVLLVKRKDIVSRWSRDTDLSPLMCVPGDERWRTLNVLGQVVNIIRESRNSGSNGQTRTSHVRIPACYRAGITIAVLTGSEAHKRLLQAPELPLLLPDED